MPHSPHEQQARDDVDAEIAFHLDARTRDLEGTGLSHAEARSQAEREFGDLASARSKLGASAAELARRSRRRRAWDEFRQDVRYGLRQLRAQPAFAVVAVLTLALGAGSNAAIFSVVDAVLLRPLRYADADRLVMVWESHPERSDRNVVSRGNYLDWREQADVFTDLGAYMVDFGYTVTGEGEATYWIGSQLTPSIFSLLGVAPALGRTIADGEEDAIVLSNGLWRRRYGADPGVLGRTLQVNGDPHTIVGVMPPGFDFPSARTEFWLATALGPEYREQRQSHVLRVLGRLAPGETVESADAAMDALALRTAAVYPAEMEGWSVNVVPLREDLTAGTRPILLALLGAVGLVLLLACANVANLLLARASARERELAVRIALGAGRGRLLRQLLTESALLALLGGVLGWFLAFGAVRVLVAFGPQDVPFLGQARLDARVLAFMAAAMGSAVLLIGVVPALRAAATPVQERLRDNGGRSTGSVRHGRVRHAILAIEVALSVLLLIVAGLLGRSLLRVQAVDDGYASENLVLASLSITGSQYSGTAAHAAFYESVLEQISAIPGVESVAGTSEPPIIGFDQTQSFLVEGRPDAFDGMREDYPLRLVTPAWFETVGIPLLRGRTFTPQDRAGAPAVVVINQSMASLLWPDGDAIGARIRLHDDGPWAEIVGIVGDVRQNGLERPERPAIYGSYAQKGWQWLTWMTVAVRAAIPAEALAPALRAAVRNVDATVPVQRIATLDELYAESLARRRFQTVLVGTFALAALLLGAVGVYGVASYTVAQRRDEMRVRLALGARPAQVMAMIMGEEMRVAAAGVLAGTLAALAVSRLLTSQLFGIAATDPATLTAACILLASISALSTFVAARRAVRVPLRP